MEKTWNNIYENNITPALARLRNISGVVLGFHSVIDGIKRVKAEEIEAVLNANPDLKQEVLAKLNAVPIEISSPADMLAGLLHSLRAGRSFRMVIREESAFRWIMKNFGYDRLKLGGTSGCMANSLAPLGIRKILVYANPLTKQLLELFVDSENLFVATQIGDEVQLKQPRKAYQREGIEAMHWGFEFAEGTTIKLPACRAGHLSACNAQAGGAGRNDLTLTAPRTSRFYPCWNPVNNKLQLSEAFKRGVLQYIDQFSHFIVAGYQVLSPDYPDGTTCIDYMLPTLEYLKELKDAMPELKLHFECDTIPADKIRRGILEYVLPQMDSMGLNEVELDYFIKDMRGEKIGELGGAGSVEYYFQGLMELAELTGLKRIHFHNLGYYICIQHRSNFQFERTRQAMILAAVIAAQRALTGDVTSAITFEQVKEIPFSQEGLEQMQAIAKHISAPASFFETGIFEYHSYNVIFLPTKVVRNPALTVGLGDTISAVAFLAE